MSNPGNICPAVTSITCTMERGRFPGDEDPSPATAYCHRRRLGALFKPVGHEQPYPEGGRKEEYHWAYKAEVVFAIMHPVPLPMLASSAASKEKYGEDLPQSSNPFARPSREDWIKHNVEGRRRPDIILVKKRISAGPDVPPPILMARFMVITALLIKSDLEKSASRH